MLALLVIYEDELTYCVSDSTFSEAIEMAKVSGDKVLLGLLNLPIDPDKKGAIDIKNGVIHYPVKKNKPLLKVSQKEEVQILKKYGLSCFMAYLAEVYGVSVLKRSYFQAANLKAMEGLLEYIYETDKAPTEVVESWAAFKKEFCGILED
jgi:hypothetical protein